MPPMTPNTNPLPPPGQQGAKTAFDSIAPVPQYAAAVQNNNLVQHVPDPRWGGMREVSFGYYQRPELGGAITIPTANPDPSMGVPLSGFDPNAPMKQNIVDTSAGGIVVNEVVLGIKKDDEAVTIAPQPIDPHGNPSTPVTKEESMQTAQPDAQAATANHFFGDPAVMLQSTPAAIKTASESVTPVSSGPIIQSTGFTLHSPNGSTRQISEEELAHFTLTPAAQDPLLAQEIKNTAPPAVRPVRAVVNLAGKQAPAAVAELGGLKAPGVRVEIGITGMTLREMYHEVVYKKENSCLVLIFDTRWSTQQGGRLPPVFQPNEPEKPLTIKVVHGNNKLEVFANYFGQTFEDMLGREFTLFMVVPEESLGEDGQE